MHAEFIDEKVQKAEEIVQTLANDINEIKKIIDVEPTKVHVYVAPEWKWKVFDIAKEVGKPDIGRIMGQASKQNIHGKRPFEYLDEIGLLGSDVLAAHAVWLDEDEMGIINERDVALSHNPASNMQMEASTSHSTSRRSKALNFTR